MDDLYNREGRQRRNKEREKKKIGKKWMKLIKNNKVL